MAETALTLTINGIDYSGWKSIDVIRNISEIAGSFTLELVDIARFEGKPAIRAGDSCKVTVQPTPEDDPITILNGYIDSVGGSLNSTQVRFTVSGRDVTCDLVDCSVTQASEWKNILFEDFVAEVIQPFGLTVLLDSAINTGDEIPTINYDQGTKVYELIAKHAQLKQLLLYPQPSGEILITRSGTARLDTAFIEGENILSMDVRSSWQDVYSEYIVKGSRQSTAEDDEEETATQISAETQDNRIKRFRPLIIIPDSEQSNISAQDRADWEATTRIAKAEPFTVVRQGWQPAINRLAYVKSNTFNIDGDYLIEGYRLRSDNRGKRTEFSFVHPRAYATLEGDVVNPDDKDSALNQSNE